MFDLTRPCVNCPFRKGQGELFGMHRERLKEIINAPAFQCHKTVVYGEDDNGETADSGERPQQCAGLMAVLHRSDKPNQIMQVAERFGHLDPTKLDPRNEAYASIEDALRAHRKLRVSEMQKNNPACYECPKGRNKLHTWKRNKDGTATCTKCNLTLRQNHADEVFDDS